MKPCEEVLPYGLNLTGARETVLAKDQPEYLPLPALALANGEIITRWELFDEEVEDVLRTKNIYLKQLTSGQGLQPQLPQTETDFLAVFGYEVPAEVKAVFERFNNSQTVNPSQTVHSPDSTSGNRCLLCEKPFAQGHKLSDCVAELTTVKDTILGWVVRQCTKSGLDELKYIKSRIEGSGVPDSEPIECQKCGKTGGKVLTYQDGGCSHSRWCCPFCSDTAETNTAKLKTQVRAACFRLGLPFTASAEEIEDAIRQLVIDGDAKESVSRDSLLATIEHWKKKAFAYFQLAKKEKEADSRKCYESSALSIAYCIQDLEKHLGIKLLTHSDTLQPAPEAKAQVSTFEALAKRLESLQHRAIYEPQCPVCKDKKMIPGDVEHPERGLKRCEVCKPTTAEVTQAYEALQSQGNEFQCKATAFAAALLMDFSYPTHQDEWRELESHRFGEVMDYVIDYLCEANLLEKHPEQNWYRLIQSPVDVLESFPIEEKLEKGKGHSCLICDKPYRVGHRSSNCLARLKAENETAQLELQGFRNWALKLANYLQPAQTGEEWGKDIIDVVIARLEAQEASLKPIDMILPCPKCGMLHVDAPEPENGWTNPPHKSHLCHGCGTIFRPADIATNGVAAIKTRGENDSPISVGSEVRLPVATRVSDAPNP
jgi:hypothetical protein